MLPFSFDPAQLAPALPDVIVAVGLAFALAVITFRSPKAPGIEEASAVISEVTEEETEEEAEDNGS